MQKVYNPETIEKHWYHFWEESGFFKPSNEGVPYCIMLPPPNVTGSLHMGHAFQDTIMDALIRYHRMLGHKTLWQGGTDHAGIATQMVVERQLAQKEINRHDLGREKFIEKIWEWKAESGNTISQQMRRLAASVDWSKERFTMDEGLSEAVKEVFVRLYEEGLIYKGKRLVNWDPKLHTAVSDLEVISNEEESWLWHIRYPIVGHTNRYLVVATTRPETMLGDMAVAVHPQDPRYQDLIGKKVQLPLTERLIPIIADEYVDPEFGTGCVKITPAHDFNDYEVGRRHGLDMINIFDVNAHLNQEVPDKYRGVERYEAREKIVHDLENLELIEKIDPHTLKVPRGDRSGVVVEPYLTDQWFVKVKPLAEPAIEAVKSGQVTFVPENWSKTYFEWMDNIQDWCISRQLWWGHRIPAWTDQNGKIYVARSEEEVRQKFKLSLDEILTQEEDVLDTWFSSALWPFSTLGWPHQTDELKTFYPTNVLVTGFDIIFFWVARMIMMGLKFTGKPPFSKVFVHGLIQDPEGQKMSKSKGNVLDPLDLIDGIDLESLIQKRTKDLMQPQMAKKVETITRKQFPEGIPSYGTDALRFTFLALATTGRHIRFDLHRIEGYRNFCNKIWNATRYVLMNVEGHSLGTSDTDRTMSMADMWIWSKLQHLKNEVAKHIQEYRFDLVASALYDFTWNTYCDWYLELSKSILNQENTSKEQLQGTRYTLVAVLEELIRLMHPCMPFITEEIWQKLKTFLEKEGKTIMLESYPKAQSKLVDETSEKAVEWIKTFVTAVRNIRGEMNIAPSKPLKCLCFGGTQFEMQSLNMQRLWIQNLSRLESIEFITSKDSLSACATRIAGNMEIYIPLKGLIDIEAETSRLKKEIDKHQKEKTRSENKLKNERFVSNAPKEVVEEEQRRLDEAVSVVQKLQNQLNNLQTLD